MSLREHELHVRRTARYYTLGEAGPALRDCWIACHGYGQLAARFIRGLEPVAAASRCIVAPEGLSRFYVDVEQRAKVGASWMTKEQRQAEIADYVAYLDAVCDQVLGAARQAVRLTALGFSQGASTVSRWVAFGRHAVDRLILWGGELPPDLDLAGVKERFANVEVIVVRGTRDEYITAKVVKSILGRLQQQGVSHRLVEFDGGHEINEAVLRNLG
jgi:predicted esterase